MLRTTHELLRHDVQATDGAIGTIRDFLFDDSSWTVRNIIVDTNGLLAHHDVLITPDHVVDLKFPAESMVLNLTKADVEGAADAATSPPVSKQDGDGQAGVSNGDPHLRSVREVATYRVAAMDAAMGDVRDLVIETSTWTIRYLIVDTGEWLGNKLVLLGPNAITAIAWRDQAIETNLTADAIRHCPAYDGQAELTRDYEAFLHDYYGWPPYWS